MRTEIRSCEDALRVLAASLDGEMEAGSDEFEAHLSKCRSCYSRAEFERRLKAQLATLGHESVRPELTDRVHTLISKFTVAGGD